jgi:hypothetical protein
MQTIKEYNKYIIDFNSINEGMQIVFRFDNNYGLSIACHSFSYGRDDNKFEVAVIKFNSDDDKDWDINYSTSITQDVYGTFKGASDSENWNQVKLLDINNLPKY